MTISSNSKNDESNIAFDEVLTANNYQKLANRTINPELNSSELLLDGLMGLNGESGEAIDIYKKHLFQGHNFDRDHLIEEIGDVAWYLAIVCTSLNIDLDYVLKANIKKLSLRYPEKFTPELSINR